MPKKLSISSDKRIKKTVKSQKNKVNNHVFRNKTIGLVFLILAVAIMVYPSYLPKTKLNDKNPIVISSKLLSAQKAENMPVRVLIPKSDIDIPIIPAKVVGGYWELSEHTASYGLGSGYPGTASNTVVFAHAREGLFYNLKDVQAGDTIYVFTQNKWYRYKVNKITAVYPNQTDVIKPTKKETLTLYTCTGFSDEKRLIITAVPQN